jgi:hypothetical protein
MPPCVILDARHGACVLSTKLNALHSTTAKTDVASLFDSEGAHHGTIQVLKGAVSKCAGLWTTNGFEAGVN